MEQYDAELLEIARCILAEQDYAGVSRTLLTRVVELTGAESGFLVVREEGSFRLCFEVGQARAKEHEARRRFSSGLVREVIESGAAIHIPNLLEDPRFAANQSAQEIGACSLLVSPLCCAEEVYGVVYLESRQRVPCFDEAHCSFLARFSELAGLFLLRALEREQLRDRNRQLEHDLFKRFDFSGIITRHPSMMRLLEMVAQVADAEAPVLIQGETGTGKELIARAVHLNSARRGGPFIVLHCSALPTELLESELFGHVAGAFTGAQRSRRGRLATAHGGTLFLDEIGELSGEVQAKLLRFLQFGELQRVGSDQTEQIDARVVAATHRDLAQRARQGCFREDLYYRLKVLELEVPPLRRRRSDILLLAHHFLERSWRREGETPQLAPAVIQRFRTHEFPGNVRELAHLIERVCVLARGPVIDVDLLPPDLAAAPASDEPPGWDELSAEALKVAKKQAVAGVERQFLTALMKQHRGNVSRASRESGIHRSYLQKLLARHPEVVDQ